MTSSGRNPRPFSPESTLSGLSLAKGLAPLFPPLPLLCPVLEIFRDGKQFACNFVVLKRGRHLSETGSVFAERLKVLSHARVTAALLGRSTI